MDICEQSESLAEPGECMVGAEKAQSFIVMVSCCVALISFSLQVEQEKGSDTFLADH